MLQNISIYLTKEEQKKFNKLTLNEQRKINEQLITVFNKLVDKQLLNKKRNLSKSLAQ